MAGRGPPKIPTKLLAARGSWLAADRIETEPVFGDAQLSPPKLLAGVSLETWNQLIGSIVASGILADVDRNALCAACERWARYVLEIEKPMDEQSENIINNCLAMYLRYAERFGLTPADRARVKVEKKSDGNKGMASLVKVG